MSGQPSKELRKNLKVTLRSDGQIEVNGDLDFADPGYNIRFTTLKGNIINGTVNNISNNITNNIITNVIKNISNSILYYRYYYIMW